MIKTKVDKNNNFLTNSIKNLSINMKIIYEKLKMKPENEGVKLESDFLEEVNKKILAPK